MARCTYPMFGSAVFLNTHRVWVAHQGQENMLVERKGVCCRSLLCEGMGNESGDPAKMMPDILKKVLVLLLFLGLCEHKMAGRVEQRGGRSYADELCKSNVGGV